MSWPREFPDLMENSQVFGASMARPEEPFAVPKVLTDCCQRSADLRPGGRKRVCAYPEIGTEGIEEGHGGKAVMPVGSVTGSMAWMAFACRKTQPVQSANNNK